MSPFTQNFRSPFLPYFAACVSQLLVSTTTRQFEALECEGLMGDTVKPVVTTHLKKIQWRKVKQM